MHSKRFRNYSTANLGDILNCSATTRCIVTEDFRLQCDTVFEKYEVLSLILVNFQLLYDVTSGLFTIRLTVNCAQLFLFPFLNAFENCENDF